MRARYLPDDERRLDGYNKDRRIAVRIKSTQEVCLDIHEARQLISDLKVAVAKDCEELNKRITSNDHESFRHKVVALENRLIQINNTIYAVGAPLGSDQYFRIRKLANLTQRIEQEATP